ncbi:hypothetical protein ASPZODRAFT_77072 [Penicilliopsis zonata CBS 506.65]|uniref:Trichothecene 3-O-acetyltransferase-like N-terminal domain-containing protein n=1 Tax=Penicilliopsis zonata CBS 506.65 TaxID=1073090 RepID=A0A1L9S5B3_9EURO|nr:hypothetical protein ASPZODRAFT_77072 [Penicilliopsis zonata CBS 506.65]OJJ42356.1 hypothetical protein ASPZODRAFT_77072 [Penicilliopsis zonata CBS 506.65]
MDAQDFLQLTALERIGPKGYLRYVFPFQLAGENYNPDDVARVLQAGYDVLIARLPVVGCGAVPDTECGQKGVMKFERHDENTVITVKDLRDSFYPYSELKARSFPVAALDADTLCCRAVWPSAGEQQLPISLVQANFIPGGLILTWCILHMAGDSVSFNTWLNVWAEGCRLAQGEDIPDPIQLPDAIWTDRKQVTRPSGRNHGRVEDHPEYTLLPFTPTEAPPKMISPNHRGQVFYLSPESLAMLKADASPANATTPSDQTWVSTNDAVSALLWRTVMAVQSPLETLQDKNPVSVFNIAIDGRRRTHPPVHRDTLGCFLEYIAVSCPIRDMLASLSLADLAIKIRQAVLRADKHFTDDVVTLVDRLEDVDRLVPTAFLDVPGFNCVQSSWAAFDVYTAHWGQMLGRIEAVRVPHVGCINGLQLVLPPLPDGGMEVMVGVEETCLGRLKSDPFFSKYAALIE